VSSDVEGADLLRRLLKQLDWPAERLAREVNRIAGRDIVAEKTPYGWLRGTHPRGHLPRFVALALSQALDETISPAMLWPEFSVSDVAISAHEGLDLPWTEAGALRCAQLISIPTGYSLTSVPGPMLLTAAVDWLTVPTTAAPTRTRGITLDPGMVRVLDQRIIQLRQLDDAQSSPLVLDLIINDLRLAAGLAATSSYDRVTGVALFEVLAQLGQLAGWVSIDLNKMALGQRFLLAALRFAHSCGNRDFAANIVSCLGYQTLWTGDGASAMRLMRLARQGTSHTAHPQVAALLASREGRAHALLGDHTPCAAALEDASAAYARFESSAVPGPPWAYWINEAVLVADAGRAWLEAGEPGRAALLLTQGLELLGTSQPRNRLLHGLSLSDAYLRLGEVDGAVEAGTTALAAVKLHGSIRVRTRIEQVRDTLKTVASVDAASLAGHMTHIIDA
jgi:hypothetical protein